MKTRLFDPHFPLLNVNFRRGHLTLTSVEHQHKELTWALVVLPIPNLRNRDTIRNSFSKLTFGITNQTTTVSSRSSQTTVNVHSFFEIYRSINGAWVWVFREYNATSPAEHASPGKYQDFVTLPWQFIHLGAERHCESEVSCPTTQRKQALSIRSPEQSP